MWCALENHTNDLKTVDVFAVLEVVAVASRLVAVLQYGCDLLSEKAVRWPHLKSGGLY